MYIRTTLLGAASVAAIFYAGAADAKAKHHSASAASAGQAELKQEVQTLKSEVQSLESRLNAQAEAQEQTKATAQAAANTAQTAQATAEATQTQVKTQIETIPSQVETATKAAAPKPGWWDNTTVGATIFANTSYVDSQSNGYKTVGGPYYTGYKTPLSGTDYDVKRFYLQVDHKFSDIWSAEGITDFTYDSTTRATQLYIKKLYLQASVNPAFNFRAGAADLPWIPFIEKLYPYRYVEKEVLDRDGFGTTTDWGLHAYGSFYNNIFSYAVSVVDGNGYKQPATGTVSTVTSSGGSPPVCCQTANVDIEARGSVTYAGFTAAVGGYDGHLGKSVIGYPYYNSVQRFDALAGYSNNMFRLYGEYFWANHWSDVNQPVPGKTNTSEGYSILGSVNFLEKFSVFGRYDWVQPQDYTNSSYTENYYNAGLSYNVLKGIDVALVFKHDSVFNGLLSTANGSIGMNYYGVAGVNPAVGAHNYGTYDEVGIFSRVQF